MSQLPAQSDDVKPAGGFMTSEPKRAESAGLDSEPSYTPQFSKTTHLILDRIKNGSQGQQLLISDIPASAIQHDEAAYEDAKSRLVQSMNTTLTIPTPKTPAISHTLPLAPTSRPAVLGLTKFGMKRKRDDSTEKVDFTHNTMAFSLPKTPNTPDGSLSRLSGNARPRSAHLGLQDDSPRHRMQHQDDVERLRQKQLSALPPRIKPAKPELVGFTAGPTSSLARTEYFRGMKRIDLLNILSLCDQIKPQLLVDVLVSVSKKHPELPIFDSPHWESNLPSAAVTNTGTRGTGSDERSRPGRSLVNSKARQRQKRLKKILKRTRVIEVVTDAPDEEVLPPTWSKANEGLYSKLPPETEDRKFLLEENDEESFSHFLVDSYGKQIVDPVGG